MSIGLPTINRSRLAQRAINSVLEQTYRDVELIVSDDVSTDDTVACVERIADARLVIFRQKERLGLVSNFDFCLRHATGEFFLLLGDDDLLLPQAIERLVYPFLQPSVNAPTGSLGVVWCPCRIATADNSGLWTTEAGPPSEAPEDLLAALWAGNRGPRLSSVLMRTTDALAIGGFQSKYGDICDMGCWGAVALLHDRVVCVPDPLVQYTNHYGSTTSQSAVRKWQDWAGVVHADLIAITQKRGNRHAEDLLRQAKSDFISGITLTILIQTIGKPGWIRNGISEVFRSPGAIFTPYVLRRLLKDGGKILELRQSSKRASGVVGVSVR